MRDVSDRSFRGTKTQILNTKTPPPPNLAFLKKKKIWYSQTGQR
jgi:hypothetical protein